MTPYRTPEAEAPRPTPPRSLGELRSRHGAARPMRLWLYGSLVTSSTMLAGGLATKNRGLLTMGFVSLAILGLVTFLAEWAHRYGALVEVWDEGLVVKRQWTDDVTMFFEDIDAAHYDFEVLSRGGVRVAPTAKVTLTSHDGRRLVVPRGLLAMNDILKALDRHVVRPLLAPAKRALDDGELLCFGPIELDARGLRIGAESYAWSELERVVADPDAIEFWKKGSASNAASIAVADIPHPRVLLVLLRTRLRVEAQAGFWGE